MTDIKMLPLPEPELMESEAEAVYGYDASIVQDYARAVAEHNVTARDAEIEALRAEVGEWKAIATWEKEQHDRLFKEARALNERAERLAEALRGLKDLMLKQVKWTPCDCGCPQKRTPDGPHSVTWLRAAQQVEIAISKAEGKE